VFVPSVEVLPDTAWKEEESNKRIEDAKMLIVEDNESIKQMLVSIFETFYQVTPCGIGQYLNRRNEHVCWLLNGGFYIFLDDLLFRKVDCGRQ